MPSRRLPALLALGLLAALPAHAADFDPPFPPPEGGYGHRPPPPPEPVERAPRLTAAPHLPPPRFERPDGCRTFVRRRFDEDGEPVVRRVQVCDERAGYRPHRGPRLDFDGPPVPSADVPFDEAPRRRWDGPRW